MLEHKIEKLKSFDVVYCKMVHEKILSSHEEFDTAIKRMPLCEKQFRDKRLGCAHGSSNIRFIETLRTISNDWPSKREVIDEAVHAFNQLLSQIYLLDHKRGHLEYDLYILKHKTASNTEIDSIKNQIETLEIDHTQLLTKLNTIRQDIINVLTE